MIASLYNTGRRHVRRLAHEHGRLLQYAILGILLLACVVQFRDLLLRLSVELHTTTGDFLIPGRAILNGYVPYRDHLDVKAPGVIFLGALSIILTGDGRAVWAFKLFIQCAIPILVMALAHRAATQGALDWFRRWTMMASAFLFGSELSLHVIERGGNNLNNAEPFGVFFALLYLLVIAWDRHRMSYLRLSFAALFMLCTLGTKEPFLFILLAIALLLARDVRFFVRSFLVPLAIASVAGVLVLGILGYLHAYLTVDIPTILLDRMSNDQSVFFRGLMSFRIYDAITRYSRVGPMLGYIGVILLALHPLYKRREAARDLWLTSATAFAALGVIYFTGMYWHVLDQLNHALPLDNPIFRAMTVKYAIAVVAGIFLAVLLARRSPRLLIEVALSGSAVYLVTFAIGSGNFLAQHFLLAVPFYAAIFLLFVENPRFLWPIVLFPLIPFQHEKVDYAAKIRAAQHHAEYSQAFIPIAEDADALMRQCRFPQYYGLGHASGIGSYTKHSPTDQSYAELSGNPMLRERFVGRLMLAPVIFTDAEYLRRVEDTDVRSVLEGRFTETPPSCAQGMTLGGGVIMLFRDDSGELGPPVKLPPVPLSHFLPVFNGAEPLTARKQRNITAALQAELDFDPEDPLSVEVQVTRENVVLTAVDPTTQESLGEVVLSRTDGSVVSKSNP
ncbi:MAG: hypothetical protein WED34_09640 [Planctomycetales bacterium]